MGLESTLRIEASDIEEHQKLLAERLDSVQLEYAESIFLEKNPEGLKFSEILKKSTSVIWMENSGDVEKQIDDLYQKGGDWKKPILELLQSHKVMGRGIEGGENETKQKAGILNCNVHGIESQFSKFGFDEEEECLEIHMSMAFVSSPEIGLEALRKSLSELAELIVDKYPQVKFVVGRSWLMDHPIIKKLGFNIIERYDSFEHRSTWWQLINKVGQLDKNKTEAFLKTWELPYKVALGFMPVEDFLRKFLPKDRRGDMVLIDLSPEYKENKRKIDEVTAEFKKRFNSLSPDKVRDFFIGVEPMERMVKTPEGQNFLSYLEKKRSEGVIWEELKNDQEFLNLAGLFEQIYEDAFRNKIYIKRLIHI